MTIEKLSLLTWTIFISLSIGFPVHASDGGTIDAGANSVSGLDAGASDGGEFEADSGRDESDADAGHADAGNDDAGVDANHDAGVVRNDGGLVSVDAGLDSDGGHAGPCEAYCDADTLFYCDTLTGEAYTIDCVALDARCGELNPSWGMDCLLAEGAECSAQYADGNSRCDPSIPLFCNAGTCQRTAGEPDEDVTAPSNAGGISEIDGEDPHPFACLGCDDSDLPDIPFSLLFIGFGVRKLRRTLQKKARAGRNDAE